MELLAGIETRRSFRAFKSTPVTREVLERILKAASKSPSYTNTQPWEVVAVSGKRKEELSRILCDLIKADVTSNPDLPPPENWPPELDKRAKEHGMKRFKAIGVERANEQQRKAMSLLNYEFYGAPCVLFLFMDSELGSWSVFDMGLFAQTLILAAHSFGVGSCLQASLARYPDAVREFLGIPGTKQLVLGISLGYPDLEARLNTYQTERVGLDDFVQWHS